MSDQIKESDFRHTDKFHQYATRCRNCKKVIPYVSLSKETHTYIKFLSFMENFMKNGMTIDNCPHCKMRTIQDYIAVSDQE